MYDSINLALETTLAGIVNVPHIQRENDTYIPTRNTPYIKTRFIPQDRTPAYIGFPVGQSRYEGIFQILLNYPEDKGIAETAEMVKKILQAFNVNTTLTKDGVSVTISKTTQMRAEEQSPWYKTPVNVHWYSYTT